MGRLEGKCAMVTGAAGGIGRAAALLFAERGARVLATDVNDAVTSLAETDGIQTALVDVTDEAAVQAAVGTCVAELGRIDVMFGQLNPLRRAGQPEEVARLAAFLASDEASYVNGQALVVDGGLSTSHPFIPGKMW